MLSADGQKMPADPVELTLARSYSACTACSVSGLMISMLYLLCSLANRRLYKVAHYLVITHHASIV